MRSTLAQLVKLGLLLRNDSPERKRDGRIANEWSAWLPQGSFHFSTKDAVYVDRSNWSSDRLKSVLPKTPQPKIFKTVKGAEKTALPSRVFPDSEFVRVLMAERRIDNSQKKNCRLRLYPNYFRWSGVFMAIYIHADSGSYSIRPAHRLVRDTREKYISWRCASKA